MPNLSQQKHDGRRRVTIQSSFTRPSDTTTYTIGDVIGPVTTPANLSWANAVRANGWGGKITGVTLTKSDKNVTLTTFDLYLFDSAPAAIADNAEFLPTDAEILNLIGIIPLAAASFVQSGGATNALNAAIHRNDLNLDFALPSTATTIYGALVARGAWVPTSAEVVAVTLHIEQD